MQRATRLFLAVAATLFAPGLSWAADSDAVAPFAINRVERDQRQFGDVRFIMGSGQAMRWLEMYTDGNLVAAYRDFDAQDVHASPDGNYFLAISNKAGSSYAFAVLDRRGRIIFSSPHTGGTLRHCGRREQGNRYWVDAAKPAVRFETESIQWAANQQYLRAVTVRGCDGKDDLLGQAMQPQPAPLPRARALALTDGRRVVPTPNATAEGYSPYFIGNTIANLRGLDPTFGARTLTLVDGRRTIRPKEEAEATPGAAPSPIPDAAKDHLTGQ
jgi:hypothetical protein